MWSWLTATDNRHLTETAKFGYIPGLAEKSDIGLKNFYMRRFVRLYPALLFMIFGTVLIYALADIRKPLGTELAAAVFYFKNIFQVFLLPSEEGLRFMPWTHLWSLAVEEHFYLIFPAFMMLCRKNWKRAALILMALLVAGPLWRSFIIFGTDLPYVHYNYMMTDTRFDSLAWGCLLSVLLHLKGNLKPFKPLLGIIPTILAGAAIITSFLIRDETFRYTIRFTLQGAALFVLVLNFYYLKALRFAVDIMEWKWLAWIGQISYALYLWHVPINKLVHRIMDRGPMSLLVATLASFAIAAFSFYVVEKPFVALRKRFGAHIVKRNNHNPHTDAYTPKQSLSGQTE